MLCVFCYSILHIFASHERRPQTNNWNLLAFLPSPGMVETSVVCQDVLCQHNLMAVFYDVANLYDLIDTFWDLEFGLHHFLMIFIIQISCLVKLLNYFEIRQVEPIPHWNLIGLNLAFSFLFFVAWCIISERDWEIVYCFCHECVFEVNESFSITHISFLFL